MLAIVEPQTSQTLTVANGATTFAIAAAIFDLMDVRPGDRLWSGSACMIIRGIDPDSGAGTLLQGWPGPSLASESAWYIEQSQASRQSLVGSTEMVATANGWLARVLSQATPWAVLDRVAAPPANPAEGDTYLASPTASGGFEPNKIYRSTSGAWVPIAPRKGDSVFVVATRESMGWNGTAWGAASPAPGTVTSSALAEASVTNAKLADMPGGRLKGRAAGGNGPLEDLTVPEVRTLLNIGGSQNLLINGDFDIWQRATAGTGGFLADRWLAMNTTAVSRSSDVPAGGSGYSLEFTGTTFPAIRQRIEMADARHGARQEVTVSLWAANVSGSTPLWIELASAGAADNFATTNSIGTAIVLSDNPAAAWTLYTAKLVLPAAAANGLQLVIVRGNGGPSTTRIKRVSIVTGDAVAVGDTFLPRPIKIEQSLCNRFFQRVRMVPNLTAFSATAVNGPAAVEPMHHVPTVTATGLLQIIRPGTNLWTQSAPSMSATGGPAQLDLNIHNFSDLTISAVYQLYLGGNGNHLLADAEL